jgi:prevent-host-death family protein
MVHNISQAKTQFSALIKEVQKGKEVILTKAGRPVARLVPYRPARKPGSMAGRIWIAPDFDTLPEDMAEAMGGAEAPRGLKPAPQHSL